MNQIPESVFSARLSPGARLLACLLWQNAIAKSDASAEVWMSKQRIRAKMGSPRGTLDRHLRELAGAGLITKLYSSGGSHCTGWALYATANGHRLDIDPSHRPGMH